MFGLYRLLLAILVALSHFGLIVAGFYPGQWSVVCFYVLSGFLMERQFIKLSSRGGTRTFYIDRILRILPLYLVVVAICAFFSPVSLTDLLLNFSLFPLNYAIFTGVPILVGPAWSLACEAHFYLLVPLLFVISRLSFRSLLAMSMAIFAASPFLPHNAFWAYGGLPGILFTFMSGMAINRGDWKTLRVAYLAAGVFLIAFSVIKRTEPHFPDGININVCIGFLIAIPATFYLSRLSPQVRWDQILGLFCFPLFLIHMLVKNVLSPYLSHGFIGYLEFVAISLLAAGVLVLMVENPSDVLRYRFRSHSSRSGSDNRSHRFAQEKAAPNTR